MRGQQLAAHAVGLTDVPPQEAAQEGPQGGWRLDCAADSVGRPTGTQRIGGVDAFAASQRGGDQRQQLVPPVRPPRRAATVEVMVDEFPQAQVPGEGGRQEQACIGYQAMIVKDDADTVEIVLWQQLLGTPCFRAGFCSKTIIPDSEEHLLPFQEASHTPSFGGLGFRKAVANAPDPSPNCSPTTCLSLQHPRPPPDAR